MLPGHGLVVTGEGDQRRVHLLQVGHALEPVGLFLGLGECGEEHAGENADDSNHNQQFNQRKRFVSFGFYFMAWFGVSSCGIRPWSCIQFVFSKCLSRSVVPVKIVFCNAGSWILGLLPRRGHHVVIFATQRTPRFSVLFHGGLELCIRGLFCAAIGEEIISLPTIQPTHRPA
jgi:hypothetical protein